MSVRSGSWELKSAPEATKREVDPEVAFSDSTRHGDHGEGSYSFNNLSVIGGLLNNNHHNGSRRPAASGCLRDGKSKIDFVLAYIIENDSLTKTNRRCCFERNLEKAGLVLETEPQDVACDQRTCFVKIHAPWNFLASRAGILGIKKPIRVVESKKHSKLQTIIDWCLKSANPFALDSRAFGLEEPRYFMATFREELSQQYIMHDRDTFFTTAERCRMVQDELQRASYLEGSSEKFGVTRLVDAGVYSAAFPLHDGEYWLYQKDPLIKWGELNDRELLYETWASPRRWYKYQPLAKIRKYYGEKIGIYFAWLSFYTKALIPPALAGTLCVMYGGITLLNDLPSLDTCSNDVGMTVMCPQCDRVCQPWRLKDSCSYSKATYVFDNIVTVLFAIFMSVWATLFLEFWKRRQSELAWDWDLWSEVDFSKTQIRPEYAAKVRTMRVNPVTQEREPFLKFSERVLRLIASISTVVFFLCLVLAFVFGVVVYRVIIVHIFDVSVASIATSISAACINLVAIMILSRIYENLAWHLTNFEFPRTHEEFENSFTFKVFLFNFINYYSSLFYIAFFKGRFVAGPGSTEMYLFNKYRQEDCDPAGCMVELLIQLSIVMVGKQLVGNVIEILVPIVITWWRSRGAESRAKGDEQHRPYSRWEKDYHLNPLPDTGLFYEWLEMVLQYGFITLFVAAFPLAPLFAFLNNVMEIRLDAYKFVVAYRRPIPERVRDIGVWYRILDVISWLAVMTNAFVIAFTSDFVPRLMYKVVYSCDGTLENYVLNSLAIYSVDDLTPGVSWPSPDTLDPSFANVSYCRYRDYRNPPCGALNNASASMCPRWNFIPDSHCHAARYEVNMQWWHVLAARLAFIVVFEHFVFFVKGFVAYIVPDVPTAIADRMRREDALAKRARIDFELQKNARFSGLTSMVHDTIENTLTPDITQTRCATPTPAPSAEPIRISPPRVSTFLSARARDNNSTVAGSVTSMNRFYTPSASPVQRRSRSSRKSRSSVRESESIECLVQSPGTSEEPTYGFMDEVNETYKL